MTVLNQSLTTHRARASRAAAGEADTDKSDIYKIYARCYDMCHTVPADTGDELARSARDSITKRANWLRCLNH